jgi:hypothetical protein
LSHLYGNGHFLLESSGSIKIAGSMYNLETGIVEFLA